MLGALLATLVLKAAQKFSRDGHSFSEYIEAVRCEAGRIPFLSTLWTTIASALSIASGAAIGREGSMIQFAASVVSALGQRWNLRSLPLPRFVALGSAAAVAAVYQAPVAGAFFALELVLGSTLFSRAALVEMPALLLSSAAGALVSRLLLGRGPLFAVTTAIQFHWHDSLPLLLTAAALGALGPLYFEIIKGARFLRNWPLALIWSGVIVGLLSCLQPDVWGNGDSGVLGIVAGKLTVQLAGVILLLRLCATSACVGSGVVGGVFTPTVFAGSVLGLVAGAGFHLYLPHISSPTGYAVVGIACLLASVTHAPLMAACMAVELTGTPEWFPLMLLCCLLSWQIAARISPNSLYAVATPHPAVSVRIRLDPAKSPLA